MFKQNIEPNLNAHGIYPLNILGIRDVQDYVQGDYCGVKSANPKTLDVARGMRIEYDRPSRSGDVWISDIYTDPSLQNYTAFNVNNGQIEYYIDNSIKDAYYEPVFDMPSKVIGYNYIDPMGAYKPQYFKQPLDPQGYSCLTWLNDSTFHREDIMASQQAKYNQTRSTPFF